MFTCAAFEQSVKYVPLVQKRDTFVKIIKLLDFGNFNTGQPEKVSTAICCYHIHIQNSFQWFTKFLPEHITNN